MTDNPVKIINHTITRLLARREHSLHELLIKLSQRGFSEPLCLEQLKKFSAEGVQSDQRFAENYIRSKSAAGQGPMKLRQALREHQLDDALISAAFTSENIDFYTLAQKVCRKKFGQTPATEWLERQKRMRFLQYRGFDAEMIQFAIQNP